MYEQNIESIRDFMQQMIDNKEEILVQFKDKYLEDNTEIFIPTKLYPHFVYGYTKQSHNPYTINYNTLLCMDYEVFLPKSFKKYI